MRHRDPPSLPFTAQTYRQTPCFTATTTVTATITVPVTATITATVTATVTAAVAATVTATVPATNAGWFKLNDGKLFPGQSPRRFFRVRP